MRSWDSVSGLEGLPYQVAGSEHLSACFQTHLVAVVACLLNLQNLRLPYQTFDHLKFGTDDSFEDGCQLSQTAFLAKEIVIALLRTCS